jgi:UTP:GlnB (protein PII) uridylyltransferase
MRRTTRTAGSAQRFVADAHKRARNSFLPSLRHALSSGATDHLRRLARRIVDATLERVPLEAALLVGSAGRGDADYYSDLDLLLYVTELPPAELLTEI